MFLFVFPCFFRWRKQLEWGLIIEKPFCLLVSSLRERAGGRPNFYEKNNNIFNVISYVLSSI